MFFNYTGGLIQRIPKTQNPAKRGLTQTFIDFESTHSEHSHIKA